MIKEVLSSHRGLPQFSDRLNANAPPGLAPAAKPLRVSLADYAAGGQYVWGQNPVFLLALRYFGIISTKSAR